MTDEADVATAGGVGGGAMLMDLAWERQQKKVRRDFSLSSRW